MQPMYVIARFRRREAKVFSLLGFSTTSPRNHPIQAEVVKLRYSVGMTNEETAEALGISMATVKKPDVRQHLDLQRDEDS